MEALTQSGQNETARALAALAPSFNSVPQTIADGSDHVAPASLRGLGPDQVLVLVNGKRRHKSSLVHVNGTFGRGSVGTDLNAIPASAIKRGLKRSDFNMKIGESAATVGMVFYNLELPLSDSATLYSFGGITHRDGRAGAFYRFPKQTAQVVPELYADGFLPEIHSHIGKMLFDAEISYRFHPAFALAIGADNVLNTFPERQKEEANISFGRLIYSRNVLQFGQNGGFYYARMQLSWL